MDDPGAVDRAQRQQEVLDDRADFPLGKGSSIFAVFLECAAADVFCDHDPSSFICGMVKDSLCPAVLDLLEFLVDGQESFVHVFFYVDLSGVSVSDYEGVSL